MGKVQGCFSTATPLLSGISSTALLTVGPMPMLVSPQQRVRC